MRSYRYLHYDVFTDHLFAGNQLAVFLDGRGLATEGGRAGVRLRFEVAGLERIISATLPENAAPAASCSRSDRTRTA